jgi:hypothetical protein
VARGIQAQSTLQRPISRYRSMVAKLTTVSALLVSELTGFVAKKRVAARASIAKTGPVTIIRFATTFRRNSEMSGTFVPNRFPTIATAAFSVSWEHHGVLGVVVRLRKRRFRSNGQCSGRSAD